MIRDSFFFLVTFLFEQDEMVFAGNLCGKIYVDNENLCIDD